jgi:hypothetical protein
MWSKTLIQPLGSAEPETSDLSLPILWESRAPLSAKDTPCFRSLKCHPALCSRITGNSHIMQNFSISLPSLD